MGLISLGTENLLDFLELRLVLSTYDGDLRDPLWWVRKGQSPCELLGGLSGFLSRRKSRAPAATRENPGGSPLQGDEAHFR